MKKAKKTLFSSLACVLCIAFGISGCSDDSDSSLQAEQVGFEVIEILGPTEFRAWISADITREEFAALEVPPGWFKNQPREFGEDADGPDTGRFLRSPDATEEGEILEQEFFGYNWFHAATIVQAGRSMDSAGLLTASSVRKYHELTFNAGSTVWLLISPRGLVYFRIGRDADRVNDEPTLPADWRLLEYVTPVQIVFSLAPRNTVIRTDNEDSFQGPVVIEELIASGEVPHPIGVAPLVLSRDICEDASNMAVIQDSFIWQDLMTSGGFNPAQIERMLAEPTRGPFYMLNLIRYREFAQYADGRETNLTGREANALYSPIEFLSGIGAGPVFFSAVDSQIEGEDTLWEDFALVQYPCPAGFFAMITDPDFRERLENKDAGVEDTVVLVTHLRPPEDSAGTGASASPFASTAEDPAFHLVEVMDFSDVAQYEVGSGEPERTGAQAWAQYLAASSAADASIGTQATATLDVQGAMSAGEPRIWDGARIVQMPSMAGFEAWLADETRQAGLYHRDAALQNAYGLIAYPNINNIPGATAPAPAPTPSGGLPITESGVGTPCSDDADCVGIGFCLSSGDGPGFCSRMCGSGECGDGYACCRSCSELAASALPFSESACLVEAVVGQLSAAPLSCSCE